MSLYLLYTLVFLLAYLVNITYITVFYHRGIAHNAVELKPWLRNFVVKTGIWITGLDPKGWATMHRLHHKYSDTPKDPHSPLNDGIFGLALAQLKSYKRILVKLIRNEPRLTLVSSDMDFQVNWLNRKGLWLLPYALQAGIGLTLAYVSDLPLLGLAYFAGIMSHPIQGWAVNSFAHAFGYQNFKTGDNSRNNTIVALTVAGEGYQNNHHRFPDSPKFSVRFWEFDFGYVLCQALQALGFLTINQPELLKMQKEVSSSLTVAPKATA